MTQLKRRLLALLLTGVTLCSTLGSALAYEEGKAQQQAEALQTLGLFRGSDQGFELGRAPTRMEALIMLLRMLGKEQEARFYEGTAPFTDAPNWEPAGAYLSYAYDKGLTKGITADRFDPNSPATAQAYLTFMLRALGYDASDAWSKWQTLGKELGLLPSGVDTKQFRRGDAVLISYAALNCSMKDGGMTLEEELLEDSVFSVFALASAKLHTGAVVSKDSSLALILASVYHNVSPYLQPKYMDAKVITKENMAYHLGVDNLKILEGLAIEPMMTTAAHSVCLLRLAPGEDVDGAKASILANVNPNKWICVGVDPENIRVESMGNLVILIMDNHVPDALLKNFKALPEDAKGAVVVNGTVVEKQSLDPAALQNFAKRLNSLQQDYFQKNPVYYSLIPDKSYYLREDFPQYLDHTAIMKALSPQMGQAISPISLEDVLKQEDFYRTDRHWRQERLETVVRRLGEEMGFSVSWSQFTPNTTTDFIGTYSRLLDSLQPEPFTYLNSKHTELAKASFYGQQGSFSVYQRDKLESPNPYGMFLSELSPLTVIENPNAEGERRLILFSDSFGTSIAPLLLEAYSQITLVDLRFMSSALLSKYVDATNADVLFLYSATLVNNSFLLR